MTIQHTRHIHDPAALELSWDDFHVGAMRLLPTGPVWPRDPNAILGQLVRGLVGNHTRAWERVSDMLDEADPRTAYETLGMWETDCGLPDPCVDPPPTSIDARRAAVLARRHEGGTNTPMDFIEYAAALGYDIAITEFRPFRAYSLCNDFLFTDSSQAGLWMHSESKCDEFIRNNDPAGRWCHCWMVTVLSSQAVVTWMHSQSACDEFIRNFENDVLQCAFTRMAPAHTEIIFVYSADRPPPNATTYWDQNQGGGSVWDNSQSIWDGSPLP